MLESVPKLWNDTIEAHRRSVRDTIMEVTASLVGGQGLRSVTMSQIAAESGIGRATLYKYFPDVETILLRWHERQVAAHLQTLTDLRDKGGTAVDRLEAVLHAYAAIQHERTRHEHNQRELAALLHRGDHLLRAQEHLTDFLRDLLSECVQSGDVRDDVPTDDLARYCIHALSAASELPSKTAVRRLVGVTEAGLRRPS